MDRIEEIRQGLERAREVQDHPTHGQYSISPKLYVRDVSYLLQRVEELEKENRDFKIVAEITVDQEKEIARLRSKLEKRDNELAELLRGSEH